MRRAPRFGGKRRGLREAALALALGLTAGLGPAAAEKVGVAAAVHPDAFSNGGQLNIGKSIFYNERISTTGSGLVQVLLVDGSTFTVGPRSDLVIDKFVYNPKKQTGQVVATFSKGAMRYVGGKVSKNQDGVTIKTPNGSLAVRGGIVQGMITGSKVIFSFLFGKEMVFTAKNGQTYRVFQPGYTIDVSGGKVDVRQTKQAEIAKMVEALSKSDTSATGTSQVSGPGIIGPLYTNLALNMDDLVADATANRIQASLQEQLAALLFQPPGDTPEEVVLPDQLSGYAATVMYSATEDTSIINTPMSTAPNEFSLTFNAGTQRGNISVFLRDVDNVDSAISAYQLGAPIAPIGNSVPGHLGEFETTVYSNGPGGQLGPPYPFASSVGGVFVFNTAAPLCGKCDFMRWGIIGAEVQSGYEQWQFIDQIEGYWVAGDLPTVGQLPTSGTASYAGNTVGLVRHNGVTSPAVGTANLNWNFRTRTGTFNVANFGVGGSAGTINMSGTMNMSGANSAKNAFKGPLTGTMGVNAASGNAHGSFARRGSDPAAGVLGNWSAHRNSGGAVATGIYGAAR